MSDSPPRWSVSPPSLSPLMSPLLRLRFLVQKALQTVESEESVFRVGLQVGCPSLQIRRFSVERRPLCSVGRFQPAEHVTACHRRCYRSLTRQPAELVTTDAAPSGSVFWCKTVESEGFRVDCRWEAKFAGFRWKAGSKRPLCSVFRFRAGKAANSSPPSMSPLVTASPLRHASLGPKSAQEACEASSMGLQILVDPASSHMLVSKPKKVSGSIPPASGLVRAWCGPGNPALGTGLQPQSCAGNRIAPAIPAPHTGLPRRPPAAGPRVELARICFPCTSAACQPLDLSRSHCPASQRRIWEVRQRTYGEDQAVSYGRV